MAAHWCTFEEKEYEVPLYIELLAGSEFIWSPGQVLENSLGVDCLLQATNEYWTLVHRKRRPGVLLQGVAMQLKGTGSLVANIPASFRVNLLLQVKRCMVYRAGSAPRGVPERSRRGDWYCFRTAKKQQRLLETLQEKLSTTSNGAAVADVSYAAPCFGERQVLLNRVMTRSLIEHSTFPMALDLHQHSRWAYQRPGAAGFALSTPTLVNRPTVRERLSLLSRTTSPGNSSTIDDELFLLDQVVNQSLAEARISPLTGAYGDRELFSTRPTAASRFAWISANPSALGIAWLVVGKSAR
jgi:hypothetical protein